MSISVIICVFLFVLNTATLHPMTQAASAKFSGVYHNAVKAAGSRRYEGENVDLHTNVNALLKKGRLPACEVYMRKNRFMYFCRFCLHAPEVLKRLVRCEYHANPEKSWLGRIMCDLKWLNDTDSADSDLPDPEIDASVWHRYVHHSKPSEV